VLAITFCLSAFFSGSEAALFSLPPERIGRMAGSSRAGNAIVSLLSHPKRLLTTVLLGNMVVNVLFYSISFLLIMDWRAALGPTGSVLLGLASLLALVVFCEVMPKNIGVGFSEALSRFAALPLIFFQKVMWPIIWPLEKLTDAITALLGRHAHPDPLIKSSELQALIELSEKEGVLDVDVGQMIGSVMELSQIPLRAVMVPRVEMVAFEVNGDAERLMGLFCGEKLTSIPVYEERVDNVLGLVHVKDLFLRPQGKPLRELVRPALYVPESASVEHVLKRFREEHAKTAVVVDEYGAVQGLVTIEDVLEEIVGEIADEYDVEQRAAVERIDERRFRLQGNLSIREWQDLFRTQLPEFSVETVGGLVMALLGRAPQQGDRVRYGNLEFTVESVKGRRVASVIVELMQTAQSRRAPGAVGSDN